MISAEGVRVNDQGEEISLHVADQQTGRISIKRLSPEEAMDVARDLLAAVVTVMRARATT